MEDGLTNGPALRRRLHAVGELPLHTVEAGPADGTPIVLLHGFPEFWYGWRRQLGPLAREGLRVIAPDLRGYNLSGKPKGSRAYRLQALALDVIRLLRHLDLEGVTLAGHDWGGVVAWCVAQWRPERLSRLVALNAPQPAAMVRGVRRNWRQALRSWYILFFQLPRLPESLLGLGRWWPLRQEMRRDEGPRSFSDGEWSRYRQAWDQPGAFTAMLNWYRAMLRHPPASAPKGKVQVPTHIVWGQKDRALGSELAEASAQFCQKAQVSLLPGASHWVHHERVEAVNDILAAGT